MAVRTTSPSRSGRLYRLVNAAKLEPVAARREIGLVPLRVANQHRDETDSDAKHPLIVGEAMSNLEVRRRDDGRDGRARFAGSERFRQRIVL